MRHSNASGFCPEYARNVHSPPPAAGDWRAPAIDPDDKGGGTCRYDMGIYHCKMGVGSKGTLALDEGIAACRMPLIMDCTVVRMTILAFLSAYRPPPWSCWRPCTARACPRRPCRCAPGPAPKTDCLCLITDNICMLGGGVRACRRLAVSGPLDAKAAPMETRYCYAHKE